MAENALVDNWLAAFDAALQKRDVQSIGDLFVDGSCFWRDLVAFTWNIITLEGRAQVASMLEACLQQANPSCWKRQGDATLEDDGVVSSWLTFETQVGVCSGHIRLQSGSAFTLLTSLLALKQFPEKTGRNRVPGVVHGVHRPPQKTWLQTRIEEEKAMGYAAQPYVVVVGGGQAGIGLAARLRHLAVPTIVLEKNPRAGDSWRRRYKSLCLHDPVWYDHLPYLPFPSGWPVFTPKDKMGDWLEMYTKMMEICYWSSSECVAASFDEVNHEWSVRVQRHHPDDTVEEVVLRPKQLILATGMSGFPNMPSVSGLDVFAGKVHHSSAHRDSSDYAGKSAVVLGSNNSAHDIAADLWANGAAEVTMIQRSSTHVMTSGSVMEHFLAPLYSESAVEAGITTDKADMTFASIPYKQLPGFYKPKMDAIKQQDAEFYKQLKAAGFILDFGADETGLFLKYLRRGSGYYIDVGASQLIIDGKIKLRSGVNIASAKEKSVVLTDGTELPADLLVFATGYTSMNSWAAKLISPQVADKVGKCWGLGSDTTKDPGPWEGELRNMWKPTQQEALWFHGGNLHQARHYSLYLALQMKARMEGVATPVYGIPEVHHIA